MIKSNIIVSSLLILPILSFGKAGINVYIENNCSTPVTFTQEDNSLSKQIAKDSTQKFTYISTGRWSDTTISRTINLTDPNNQAIGNLTFTLDNGWLANYFDVNQQTGKISSDNNKMEWHNWYGTPNITLSACPKSLDISKSDLLKDVKRILVFGDSLSDKGTLFEYSQGVIPSSKSYYNGMFSNSDVWAKLLKNDLKKYNIEVSNYAVGGATAVLNPDLKHLPYSLSSENTAFQANALDKHWKDYNQFLAIIFIGANDYLTVQNNISTETQKTLTSEVINSIDSQVQSLIAKGVKKFVFLTLPNLSFTPESKDDLHNTTATANLSTMHNNKLRALVKSYQNSSDESNSGEVFKLIDIAPLFNDLVSDDPVIRDQTNKKYNLHITNIEDSCWHGSYTLLQQQANNPTSAILNANPTLPRTADILVAIKTSESGEMCSNPENYIFWDRVHPTKQIHQVLYQTIANTLGAKIITS
ncbi:SGNH/GDSL hydrolase family protein [Piscirickettsia litoralis]|uniref:GDSL family lipase n=1 Tax=Piscirickettsia litoralis TaxID=1891921 RepID=A0ABX3A4H1_9GAMM|nr:SGNH/GDSL hydrolase family protein [Piscirickettsia litoralis]ODN42548.1 hypothetical protein BGC07_05910 [Piscirickettsia litoralis]